MAGNFYPHDDESDFEALVQQMNEKGQPQPRHETGGQQ